MPKKVLMVGSGGREHAIVDKLVESKHVEDVFFTGENGGMSAIATKINTASNDIAGLVAFAKHNNVSLTIVGGEEPLLAGVADAFEDAGLTIYGPRKDLAQIEGSKVLAKELMVTYSIGTASHKTFTDPAEALKFAQDLNGVCFVKADGPALGKGAIACRSMEDAQRAINDCMVEGKFGDSGKRIVIEEFLDGDEVSATAVCAPSSYLMFPFCQDHKRALEGDLGLNTGGMGTVCAEGLVSYGASKHIDSYVDRLLEAISLVTNRRWIGTMFPGVMLTEKGPKILEVNARFGDPETQSLMRRLDSDLYEMLYMAATDKLGNYRVKWNPGASVTVMLCSGGYPGTYTKGHRIEGLKEAEKLPGIKLFHSGTKYNKYTKTITNGGRVLGVSCLAPTLDDAIAGAYRAVDLINFKDMYYRRDIGARALGMLTRKK